MMNCKLCREQISEYLDFQVDENLRAELDYHLALCPVCQSYVRELQAVRSALGEIPDQAVPINVSHQWVAALETAASRKPVPRWQSLNWQMWFFSMRPMLAGYGIGLVVTCVLFFGVLASLKPVMRWSTPEYEIVYIPASGQIPIVPTSSRSEAGFNSGEGYTRPSIQSVKQDGSENIPLPDALFIPNNDGSGLVFIAEVSPQGKAQLVQMVSPHSDPQMVATVNAVLGRSSFQPAKEFGHPVSSRVILLMEQIYVRG